ILLHNHDTGSLIVLSTHHNSYLLSVPPQFHVLLSSTQQRPNRNTIKNPLCFTCEELISFRDRPLSVNEFASHTPVCLMFQQGLIQPFRLHKACLPMCFEDWGWEDLNRRIGCNRIDSCD